MLQLLLPGLRLPICRLQARRSTVTTTMATGITARHHRTTSIITTIAVTMAGSEGGREGTAPVWTVALRCCSWADRRWTQDGWLCLLLILVACRCCPGLVELKPRLHGLLYLYFELKLLVCGLCLFEGRRKGRGEIQFNGKEGRGRMKGKIRSARRRASYTGTEGKPFV